MTTRRASSTWRLLLPAAALVVWTFAGCEDGAEPASSDETTPSEGASSEEHRDAGGASVEGEPTNAGASGEGTASSKGEMASSTEEQRRLLDRAKQDFMEGKRAEAKPHFKKLVETGPFSGPQASAYIALAQIYMDAGEPKKTVDLLAEVPEAGERIVELHLVRARAHAKLGNTDEAIEAYEAALRRAPDYVFVYSSLGALYKKAGRTEEAKQTFFKYEKKIRSMAETITSPESSEPVERVNTLDIFSMVQDERAVEAAEKALNDPKPAVRRKAATTLAQMKATSSLETLKKTAKSDPDKGVRQAASSAVDRLSSPSTRSAQMSTPSSGP